MIYPEPKQGRGNKDEAIKDVEVTPFSRAALQHARTVLHHTPDAALVLLDGQDATAYILSANINRRHMTKGQLAMVVAMIYPEAQKGGRGKKNSSVSEGFSGTRVSNARTVLRHTPDAAALVLSGALSLDMQRNAAPLAISAGNRVQPHRT